MIKILFKFVQTKIMNFNLSLKTIQLQEKDIEKMI